MFALIMHSLRITTTIICCMRIIATTGFDLRSKVLCNDRTSFKPTKPSTNQAKHQAHRRSFMKFFHDRDRLVQ